MTAGRGRGVLVTDAGRASAVAVLRSLARCGWRVVAGAADPRAAGLLSRFAHERFVYPDPASHPAAFVETVLETARKKRVDLLVPVTDETIHPLAHARDRFRDVCVLAVPDPDALSVVTDKERTLELARSLDVPLPPTHMVGSLAEARAAAAGMRFPLVLKPAVSRRYLPAEDRVERASVTYAGDAEDLERRARPLLERQRFLLQEYVPGVGVGVELLALEGGPLIAFQHRRLAEVPVTGGASAWRESVPLDTGLLDYSRRLLGALRWTGLIMIEFKVGDRPYLMEINGRIWGSLPLATHCGVDFPAALASLLLDGVTPSNGEFVYPYGVRAYNVELLVPWILQVLLGRRKHPYLPSPARRAAIPAVRAWLGPGQNSDVPWRGDPRPALAQYVHLAKKLAGKLGRRSKERR